MPVPFVVLVLTCRWWRPDGSGGGGDLPALAAGEHGVEEGGDDLLLGLGQAGDGVELLFEPRCRTAPGAPLGSGRSGIARIVADQRLDRHGEQLGEARQHQHGHAASADLVEGSLGLGDARRVGELDIG